VHRHCWTPMLCDCRLVWPRSEQSNRIQQICFRQKAGRSHSDAKWHVSHLRAFHGCCRCDHGLFFKRCLEVAFVHHYSGTMPKDNANGIGIFYTLITALVALTATPLADIQSERLLQIGLVLFAIGELGNGYHHYLLRMLRQTKRSNDRNYVPPAGGLFSVVATPHYFFELTAWYGLACVSQQLHAFLAAAGMTSYLAGRAVRTNQMYRETFSKEEWPRSKKALVPGIF